MLDRVLSEMNLEFVHNGSYLFYGSDNEYLKSQAILFGKEIIGENTLDSILVFGENKKTISINDIRYIRSEVLKKSTFSKYKFVVIDNADRMTIEAQNALLKTLEEQREGLFIILISNDLVNFLKTIISRCILMDFNLARDRSITIFDHVINSSCYREIYKILLDSIIKVNYFDFLGLNDVISNLSNYKQHSNMIVKMLYMIIRDVFIYKETLNEEFICNREFSKDIIDICKIYNSFNMSNIMKEIKKLKDRLSVNLNFELCYRIFILKIGR